MDFLKIEDTVLWLGSIAMFVAFMCQNDTAGIIAMGVTVVVESMLLILEGIIDMFLVEEDEEDF